VRLKKNRLYQGDCVKLLNQVDEGSVDLVFADPPFNIGYEYDVYDDRQSAEEYLDWCSQWIAGIYRALKPDGTFWLAIGDEFAAELKIQSQRAGFHCRSWVIWYYTFGVNCKNGFSRSHTHLFHLVKNPKQFTFNRSHPQIRVPSARELVYADNRANPDGRLPDNTWITRPQDAPRFLSFSPQHDTWYFARVAGTFKEREGFHGCQMPEQLLARIIRTSSRPQELVLDPFCGSGTTVCVAKKLARNWLGFELSPEYVKFIDKRLSHTEIGEPIDGCEDPIQSSPSTAKGKRRKHGSSDATRQCVIAAYEQIGYSTDYLLSDKDLNARFVAECLKAGLGGSAYIWNRYLLELRDSLQLPEPQHYNSISLTADQMERVGPAAEVAVRILEIDYQKNLEEIFCSPEFADQFDRLAAELTLVSEHKYSARDFRSAAILIERSSRQARTFAAELFHHNQAELTWLPLRNSLKPLEQSGVYLLCREGVNIFASESKNMREQIERILENAIWQKFSIDSIRYVPFEGNLAARYALKSVVVSQHLPPLNCRQLIGSAGQPGRPVPTVTRPKYRTLQLFE
jgi:DNA modification methylase